MGDYTLDIEWKEKDLKDTELEGCIDINEVKASVLIDSSLLPEAKAGTMIHELIEVLLKLGGIPFQHHHIDWLAMPIGIFMVEHGFDPQKVFEGKKRTL